MEEKKRYKVLSKHPKDEFIDIKVGVLDSHQVTRFLNEQNNYIEELRKENQQLKQQLSDEEEAHELCIVHYTEAMEDLRKQLKFECDARNRFVKRVSQLNESQKQLAISELEALARFCEENAYYYEEEQFAKQINKCINDKIKSLKGELKCN